MSSVLSIIVRYGHAASVGVATAQRRGSMLAPILFNLIRILSSPAFMGFINCLWNVSGVKVKVTLEQATKAQRGSRCIALLFLQPRR